MTRSLADLKKEVQLLGLTVAQSGKRLAKEDCLGVLRSHYLKKDFPNGLPYEELNPMLCFNYWNLTPKQQTAIWKDPNWIAQEKLNGVRVVLHFIERVGVFAHSRMVSVATYRRTEVTSTLPFQSYVPDFTAVVDAELVGGVAHVFDIIRWDVVDLRFTKLCERLAYLPDFRKAIAPIVQHFGFPPVYFQGKQAVYEKIIAAGGEGVVLKNLNYHYEDSNSRSRYGWVKVKRQVELTAYVSGFEQGKPGSKWEDYVSCLIFSVSTDQGHRMIAKVSNLPWQFRKDVSLRDQVVRSVKLDLNVYGRVAVVSGLEMSRRAFRLVHPRIAFWRSDLKQEQCVYRLADLQAARLGTTDALLLRVLSSDSFLRH